MKKITKKVIISFSVLIAFLLLFGKMLYIYILGFCFFGSSNEEFMMNELGDPLIVGESWNEEDVFQVTVAEITFSEKNREPFYDIAIVAENKKLYSKGNGDMELYCTITVPKDIIAEETMNHFTIPRQQIKEYHYKFFLSEEICDFQCQVEIPLADKRYRYKKMWHYNSDL